MSIQYTLTSKQDGHTIEQNNAVLLDKDGIIEAGINDSMRYTPMEDINIEPYSANGGYTYEKKPSLPQRPDLTPSTPVNTGDNTHTRVGYQFGLDSVQAAYNTPESISAYLSPEIDIGPGSYIQLEVDQNVSSSIEYSVIEGEEETPILPLGSEEVYEKLYWNLPTRFQIDTTHKVTILKNGVETTITKDMISAEEYGANRYMIRYTPASQSHNYTTKSKDNKVRIKAIQRCEDGMLPAVIRHMTIHRFGGDDIWNIKG